MKIGVISEGHADRAVITNIITGITGLDINDIEPIRPIYHLDETDKAIKDPLTFSSWTVVKEECETRELIDGFLAFEGQDFVVIHIDTAEAGLYGVNRPEKKVGNYCETLRERVVQQINTWLQDDLSNEILYAVAVEEIDSWVLTIYDRKDSSTAVNAKEKLKSVLRKNNIKWGQDYECYFSLSEPLSKPREIKKGKFLNYNCSLHAFVEEINQKVLPKISTNL